MGVPEVGGGLSADRNRFVLFVISFKYLLDLRSLQQGHAGGQLSVAMIWMRRKRSFKSTKKQQPMDWRWDWAEQIKQCVRLHNLHHICKWKRLKSVILQKQTDEHEHFWHLNELLLENCHHQRTGPVINAFVGKITFNARKIKWHKCHFISV